MTRLILASASTSRAQVLRSAGVEFDIVPSYLDEGLFKRSARIDGSIAGELAQMKALHVSAANPGALVIGADQVLMLDYVLMSKAETMEEAGRQLRKLRGRQHVLVSALALAKDGAVVWRHVDEPKLTMRDFSDAFLNDYLAREGEGILSSVGSYRLEGLGAQLFETVEGDYFSILGLPLQPLLGALRGFGVIAT